MYSTDNISKPSSMKCDILFSGNGFIEMKPFFVTFPLEHRKNVAFTF